MPIFIPILVGIGIVGQAAQGAAALIISQVSYNSFSEAMEKDIFCLQAVTSYLEQQVDSLAEMV